MPPRPMPALTRRDSDTHSRRGALATAVAAALVAATGCQRGGLPPTVPVQGRVTFAGGECPHEGHIFFLPAPGQPGGAAGPRAGGGRFGRDGLFKVTTLVPDDGLVPGAYSVRVVCETPAADDSSRGRSFVPAGFVPPPLTVPSAAGRLTCDIDVPAAAAKGQPAREAP